MYIGFTCLNLGFLFSKVLKINTKDFVILNFFGLFLATIIGSFWALFGRINIEFHSFLLLVNLFLFIFYKKTICGLFYNFYIEIKRCSQVVKLFLFLFFVLILNHCSQSPLLIDNETYYIQTIKWLNEYGFVKGLANLHVFLGQTSGWHIAQSVFNFSFLYANFNDLSGYALTLGLVFSFLNLDIVLKNPEPKKHQLIAGISAVFSLFLFQFTSAPSPDLLVYVLSFIVFLFFIEHSNNVNQHSFNTLSVLIFFLIFVKITILPIILLPISWLFSDFKLLKPILWKTIVVGVVVFMLFYIKNTILLGYTLYPSKHFELSSNKYSLPVEISNLFFSHSGLYSFFVSDIELEEMSFIQLFWKWLTFSKIDAIFNICNCILIICCPYFIYRFSNFKSYWIIYFTMLAQSLFLIFTSPQFRFFIPFTQFFSLLVVVIFCSKKTFVSLITISLILTGIFTLIPYAKASLTNPILKQFDTSYSANQLVFPKDNSVMNHNYLKFNVGNLIFESPDESSFFWITGNGELPCVNKQQIDYFKSNYNYIPQLRTNNLKDGFYAKRIQIYESK